MYLSLGLARKCCSFSTQNSFEREFQWNFSKMEFCSYRFRVLEYYFRIFIFDFEKEKNVNPDGGMKNHPLGG